MKRSIYLFFVMIFFAACSGGRPEGVLGRRDMIGLLTDIHIADSYASIQTLDTVGERSTVVYKSIFNKYGTDSAGFGKSLEYYIRSPRELESMYEEVLENLEAIESEQLKKSGQSPVMQR